MTTQTAKERKPVAATTWAILLYTPSHRQDSTKTDFVTPVVEHWLEKEIAQCADHKGSF